MQPAHIAPLIGGSAAIATLADHFGTTGTATATWTFNTRSIGAAAAGRRIVVCVCSQQASMPNILSVTMNGNAMTQVVVLGGGTNIRAGMYILQLDTGTTANFVVTFGTAVGRCSIMVYALYGLQSSTPVDTKSDATNAAPTVNLNISNGGIAIAAAGVTAASNQTCGWIGLTEDTDVVYDSTNHSTYTSASDSFPAGQTGRTIQMTANPATTVRALVAASFL